MTENITHRFVIDRDLDGYRLDMAISIHISDISRSRIQALIKQGMVTINNQSGKWGSSKVRQGMEIAITIPDSTPLPAEPEDIPLDILFEDAHILMINKPSGMVVHPAPGHETGTLVNAVLHHAGDTLSGVGGVNRPGIVHRIDKGTSGVLVIAKSDRAHNGLSALFKAHTIDRTYEAFIWGHMQPANGTLSSNIGRHKTERKKMAVVPPDDSTGKIATTHYKTLCQFAITSHIQCTLETGRTHQIRVHMTDCGNGLIGDPMYGGSPKDLHRTHPQLHTFLQSFHRQALHAKSLGFIHPVTEKYIFVDTKLPKDLKALEKLLDIA